MSYSGAFCQANDIPHEDCVRLRKNAADRRRLAEQKGEEDRARDRAREAVRREINRECAVALYVHAVGHKLTIPKDGGTCFTIASSMHREEALKIQILEEVSVLLEVAANNPVWDILGVTEAVACYDGGEIGACVMTAIGIVPVGKLAKLRHLDEVAEYSDEVAESISMASRVAPRALPSADVVVIGKVDDLAGHTLRPGERTLLNQLPDQGSARLNYLQNDRVLRAEMRRGVPIRDVLVDPVTGALRNNTGFLRAERNILTNHSWAFDPKSGYWYPPGW